MTLIRVCDSRVLIIICKTPHKMNCFNQRSGNDKKVVCRKAYNKNYYAKNREQILVRQKRYRTENAEILKSRRKRWYENNRKRLASSQRAYCQQNKEHIRNYRRQYSKHPHIRTLILEVRLIRFLFIGCLVKNQPEGVLKLFLKIGGGNQNCNKYTKKSLRLN